MSTISTSHHTIVVTSGDRERGWGETLDKLPTVL
jgi:hypothetical protein